MATVEDAPLSKAKGLFALGLWYTVNIRCASVGALRSL